MFGKLGMTPFRALESAVAYAKLRGNPYVELVHWLHQLWQVEGSDLHLLAAHWHLDVQQLQKDLISSLEALPAGAKGIRDFSHTIEEAVERAWLHASLRQAEFRIRSAWLMLGMLQTPELRHLLCGISPQFQAIAIPLDDSVAAEVISHSIEGRESSQDGAGLPAAVPGEESQAIAARDPDRQSALSQYCSDMTEQARTGKIDPVLERSSEIRTMTDILLRRRQNNPLLTGEAGVGKTAVVEGLALSIAKNEVPPPLRNVRLLALDVGALLAGASMRGEFEARLKSVLAEAQQSDQPVILFIDEVHTLVGAGGQAGTGDAANLLKPALARGNLRTIGATTWGEYKRHIEKDPALTRRFQVLQVMEPEEQQAIRMVRGLAQMFSAHHGVEILDEAVNAAVKLTQRYMPARQLPDKAISVLDTACAKVSMSMHVAPERVDTLRLERQALEVELRQIRRETQMGLRDQQALLPVQSRLDATVSALRLEEEQWQRELLLMQAVLDARTRLLQEASRTSDTDGELPSAFGQAQKELLAHACDIPRVCTQVDEAVVASIVADWTGIPVGRMVRDEVSSVLQLHEQLGLRVIGQSQALRRIAERIKTSKARLGDPDRPLGTFLLAGPSGVGKTETALALARALYGGEQNLITINMSEYQEAHTISSLKGSPPGYVGYGEGGVLTEAVRRRPYSVILLDEVEKAHPDVHELFYQVFDKGWMEDGEGRLIDFRNTLILLTSNAGSECISQLCEDPALIPDDDPLLEAVQRELRTKFPVAFLARLDVVPYMPLKTAHLQDIVRLQMKKVADRMREMHGIDFSFSEDTIAHVAGQCGSYDTGARHVRQFIEATVLPQLAEVWLQSMQEKISVSAIRLDVTPAPDAVHPALMIAPRKGLHVHPRISA